METVVFTSSHLYFAEMSHCTVQGNVYQAPCQFLIGKWYRYFSPEDHSPGMAWFPFA